MSWPDYIVRWKIHVLLGYILLTLLMTYPLALDMGHVTTGNVDSAAAYEIGTFSWSDKATFTLGVNPLHNSDIFYPFGADITDGGIIHIIFSPVTHIVGPIVAYNLYVLLTFVLAGFGAYLLTYHLTRNGYAAFLAGIIFAFAPVHFAHTNGGLIHLFSIQWLPFFILFLIRMTEGNKRSDVVLCALFFSLNAASSWTWGVASAIFMLPYLGLIYWRDRKAGELKSLLKKLPLFGIISIILISPFAYVLVYNMVSNPDMVKPMSEKIFYSADILSFFTPSGFNPVVGQFFHGISNNFTGGVYQNTVYAGLIALFFAIWAVLKLKKDRYVMLFAVSALVFFVLALGPYLHINGEYIFFGSVSIPLPGFIFDLLPVFSMVRCPSRMGLMLMLMVSVLAGFGMAGVFDDLKKQKYKILLFCLLAVLIAGEFAYALPVTAIDVPEFYSSIAGDGQDYAILDLPIGYSDVAVSSNRQQPVYMLYQVVHGKAIAGGPLSREGLAFRENIIGSPLNCFWYLKNKSDILENDAATVKSALRYYDIKYVIYHKDLIKERYVQDGEKMLSDVFGGAPCYENGNMTVYEVSADTPLAAFIVLGDEWYTIERYNGTYTRWIGDRATVRVVSPGEENLTLSFTVIPFDASWEIDMSVNGMPANKTVLSGPTEFSIDLPGKGVSEIEFFSPGGTSYAYKINRGLDPRELSFMFQNFTIKRK